MEQVSLPNTRVARVFDWDDTLMRTSDLKDDMGRLFHEKFLWVSPKRFQQAYKVSREQQHSVVWDDIFRRLSRDVGMNKRVFLNRCESWLWHLPFRQYVVPGARELVRERPEITWLFTKGDPEEYQRLKISECGVSLPEDRVVVVKRKTLEAFRELKDRLHQNGCDAMVIGTDGAEEIVTGYEVFGDRMRAVHIHSGAHWSDGIDGARKTFGLTKMVEALSFPDFVRKIHTVHIDLEGQNRGVEVRGARRKEVEQ